MTDGYDPTYQPLPPTDPTEVAYSGSPAAASSAPRGGVSRRKFLVGAAGVAGVAAAGTALGITRPWQSSGRATSASRAVAGGKGTLVLISLYGGNDGLNTVVPYTDSAYHAGRPNLAYAPTDVLPLADGLGLNSQLKGLKALWDTGQLAVVRGVGYANPSLSHFQSMDIWQTANPEGSGSGWLGRWLDATGTDPMRAISLGSTLPPALRGDKSAATAITSGKITLPGRPAAQAAFASLDGPGPDRTGLAAQVARAGSDLLAVQGDLDRLSASAAPSPAGATGAARPKAGAAAFGDQMQTVASLIKAGAPTRVYQVSLSSFDTHADEKADQERLLGQLDQGISAFFTTIAGHPHAEGVVLMTYSEFGRRVAENASGGTDHGTAAPLFVAGQNIKGKQFYGEQPSLTDLDDGDLKFNVDFRSVYATMFDRVLGVDPRSFLGGTFPTLDLV